MRPALILLLAAACGSPGTPPRMVPYTEGPAAGGTPDPAASMPLTLRAKFEWAESDPLHVVSPAAADGEGPFAGNELGTEDYGFLDEQLLSMAGYEGLHACYEADGGLFVLRGPGAGEPTDLFLALWDGRALSWVADLAFDHCGEDGCARMQSWLTDLDADGRRDIVRRSVREDGATESVEDVLDAWIVGGDGSLSAATLPPADRARYRPD